MAQHHDPVPTPEEGGYRGTCPCGWRADRLYEGDDAEERAQNECNQHMSVHGAAIPYDGFYLRTSLATMERSRVFEPLQANHPLIVHRHSCVACGGDFRVADLTCLIPLGPGGDREQQEKAEEGRFFRAVCVPLHAYCAGVSEAEPEPGEGDWMKGGKPMSGQEKFRLGLVAGAFVFAVAVFIFVLSTN